MNWTVRIFIMQVVLSTVLFAKDGAAQNTSVKEIKISIHLNNNSLGEAFNEIERLTDLSFIYDKSSVN
ncbi:MAG: hypothetical protein RIA62_17855, partial [Cyclobacteriaceae bacterium]